MGIKDLISLTQTYPNVVSTLSNLQETIYVDCIAFDANSLVYKSLNKTDPWKNFYYDIFNTLSFLLLNENIKIHGKELLIYIALDNGSPNLKSDLQKKRRRNQTLEEKKIVSDLFVKIKNERIHANFIKFLCLRCAFDTVPFALRFVFDYDETMGEGEQKCMRFVKLNNFINPLFISIDNDMFHICLFSVYKFDHCYVYSPCYADKITNVKLCDIIDSTLKYKLLALGNDYIPSIFSGTPYQLCLIRKTASLHEAIETAKTFKKVLYKQDVDENYFDIYLIKVNWLINYYINNVEPKCFNEQTVMDISNNINFRDSIIKYWPIRSPNFAEDIINVKNKKNKTKYNSFVYKF